MEGGKRMSCKFECMIHNDTICCFECESCKTCQIKCVNILDDNLNKNNYAKCENYIKNEEKQGDYKQLKKETVSKVFSETIYLVKIKDKYAHELYKTKITTDFCGTIINQTASNLYFELKDTKELVIIPYEYILWLAPGKGKRYNTE